MDVREAMGANIPNETVNRPYMSIEEDGLIQGTHIKDSGNRRAFDTGAVRDTSEGKGRFDLMPLDIISKALGSEVLYEISEFMRTKSVAYLYRSLEAAVNEKLFISIEDSFIEVAVHYEEGAKKYGEYNWQKGIPIYSYIDSACRHYMKHRDAYDDERHDRAFVWNILGAIWTIENKPQMCDWRMP